MRAKQQLKIVIRQAKKGDIEEIKNLVRYLMKVEEVEDVEKQTNLILKQRIISTFRNKRNKAFVAQCNNRVVGLIVVEVKHDLVAYLPYLVVDRLYQNQGIGRNLINYAKDYARSKKIKILEVVVHKDNKKSRKFHEKLSFTLFGFVLRKRI